MVYPKAAPTPRLRELPVSHLFVSPVLNTFIG